MVLLIAAVGILGYSLSESNARYRTLVADMEVMSKQISQEAGIARSPVQQARSESPSSLDTTPRPPAGAPPETNAGLIKARQDYATAEARANELQEQLQAATIELQVSRADLEKANDSQTQLGKKVAEAEQAVQHRRRLRSGYGRGTGVRLSGGG